MDQNEPTRQGETGNGKRLIANLSFAELLGIVGDQIAEARGFRAEDIAGVGIESFDGGATFRAEVRLSPGAEPAAVFKT